MAEALRVALGTTSLIEPLTGIGQYTLHLSNALAAANDLEMHYFYGYEWSDVATPRVVPHINAMKRFVRNFLPHPYEFSRAMQTTRFRAGLPIHRPELYHEPNYLPLPFDGPTILTIHDLSYLRFPETHPELRVRVMNKLLPPAIEKASHLLTDSEFTRQEVIREFGVAQERVTTTLLGADGAFHPRGADECRPVLDAHGLRYRGYVLAVGTLEPRKNLLQVIRAYAQLEPSLARSVPLVIVGGRGWKAEGTERELAPLLDDGRAMQLGFVEAKQLPILYSAACAVAYPSLYEGFGLPAAEAMASGVPILTSNRSSLPEVVADAGVQVAPDDIEGMRDAIRQVLEDEAWRRELCARGLDRTKSLNWKRCGAITASIYRKVMGRVDAAA